VLPIPTLAIGLLNISLIMFNTHKKTKFLI